MAEDGLRLAPSIPKDARPQDRYFCRFSLLVITAMTYLDTLRYEFLYMTTIGQIPVKSIHKIVELPSTVFPLSFVAGTHLLRAIGENYYRPLFSLVESGGELLDVSRLSPSAGNVTTVSTASPGHGALVYLGGPRDDRAGRPPFAWLTALIFGVHPIHHESRGQWVSGSTESLFATFFFLAAFLGVFVLAKAAPTFF